MSAHRCVLVLCRMLHIGTNLLCLASIQLPRPLHPRAKLSMDVRCVIKAECVQLGVGTERPFDDGPKLRPRDKNWPCGATHGLFSQLACLPRSMESVESMLATYGP